MSISQVFVTPAPSNLIRRGLLYIVLSDRRRLNRYKGALRRAGILDQPSQHPLLFTLYANICKSSLAVFFFFLHWFVCHSSFKPVRLSGSFVSLQFTCNKIKILRV